MIKQKTFKERVEERLEKLLYVPREKDGKLVKWNNSPMLDAVRKIFNEELNVLLKQMECSEVEKKSDNKKQEKTIHGWTFEEISINTVDWVRTLIIREKRK